MSRFTLRLPMYISILLVAVCFTGCANGPGRYIAKLWSRSTVLTDEQAETMTAENQSAQARVVANAAIEAKKEDTGRVNLADLQKEPAEEKDAQKFLAGFFQEKDKSKAIPPFENDSSKNSSKPESEKQKKPTLVLPYQEIVTGSITQKALKNQQNNQESESDKKNTFADDFDKRLAQLRSSITRDAISIDDNLGLAKVNQPTNVIPAKPDSKHSQSQPVTSTDSETELKTVKTEKDPAETSDESFDSELFEAIDRELAENEALQKSTALAESSPEDKVILLPDPKQTVAKAKPVTQNTKQDFDSQLADPFVNQQSKSDWFESPADLQSKIVESNTPILQSDSQPMIQPENSQVETQSAPALKTLSESGRQFGSSAEMIVDSDAVTRSRSKSNTAVSLQPRADFPERPIRTGRAKISEYQTALLPPDQLSPSQSVTPGKSQPKQLEVTTEAAFRKANPEVALPLLETRNEVTRTHTRRTLQTIPALQSRPAPIQNNNERPRHALPEIVPRSSIKQLSAESHISPNHSAKLTIHEEPLDVIKTRSETAPALLQLGTPIFEEINALPQQEEDVSENAIEPISYEQEATLTPILEPALLNSNASQAKATAIEKESSHAKLFVLACALAVIIGVILRFRSDYLAER